MWSRARFAARLKSQEFPLLPKWYHPEVVQGELPKACSGRNFDTSMESLLPRASTGSLKGLSPNGRRSSTPIVNMQAGMAAMELEPHQDLPCTLSLQRQEGFEVFAALLHFSENHEPMNAGAGRYRAPNSTTLCANDNETSTPRKFTLEGDR
jgi:hypothetical protein